jgi:hypothetical protein
MDGIRADGDLDDQLVGGIPEHWRSSAALVCSSRRVRAMTPASTNVKSAIARVTVSREPQVQTATNDVLLSYLRATLARQPSPPRQIDKLAIVLRMYPGILLRLSFLVGLGSALFVIVFFSPGSAAAGWALQAFFAFGVAWFLLYPAWEGLQVAARARDGLITTAEVVASHAFVGRGRIRRVTGRRIVHHPSLGDFQEDFSIAAPWIDAVTPGSQVDVLTAPLERRTWLTLGIHGDAP